VIELVRHLACFTKFWHHRRKVRKQRAWHVAGLDEGRESFGPASAFLLDFPPEALPPPLFVESGFAGPPGAGRC
jgi:hypothetical protein